MVREEDHKAPLDPKANRSVVKSMRPQLMLAGVLLAGALLAVIITWSPWDDDETVSPNQIARETPATAGTPNP